MAGVSGVIDAGAELNQSAVCAPTSRSEVESITGVDVIGQNGDPVRPLGPYARGVDEDEIRRVRRIDLLDPASTAPRSTVAERRSGDPRPAASALVQCRAHRAVGIDQKDPAAGGNGSADQGAR